MPSDRWRLSCFFRCCTLHTVYIFHFMMFLSLPFFPSRPKIAEIAASEQLLRDGEIWVVEMKKFKSLFSFWNTTQFKPHTTAAIGQISHTTDILCKIFCTHFRQCIQGFLKWNLSYWSETTICFSNKVALWLWVPGTILKMMANSASQLNNLEMLFHVVSAGWIKWFN